MKSSFFFLSTKILLLFKQTKKKSIALFFIDIFSKILLRPQRIAATFHGLIFALNCCSFTFPSKSLKEETMWKWKLAPVKFNIAIRMSEQMCAMKSIVLRRHLFLFFFYHATFLMVFFSPFLRGWAVIWPVRIKMGFCWQIKREASKETKLLILAGCIWKKNRQFTANKINKWQNYILHFLLSKR